MKDHDVVRNLKAALGVRNKLSQHSPGKLVNG